LQLENMPMFSKFFLCFVEKSPATVYGLFFLLENHLISFS